MRPNVWITSIVLLVIAASFVISVTSSTAQIFPDAPIVTLGKGWVCSVKFSPDGRYLAIATTLGIQLVSTKNWSDVALLEGQHPFDFCVSDGRLILASYSDDGKINLLDVDANAPLDTLNVNEGMISRISFSHDGKLLAVCGEKLTLWDVAKRKVSDVLNAEFPWAVDFSPDDKLLGVGLWDGSLQIWDVAKGRLVNNLSKTPMQMRDGAFSPDGRLLAAGSWDGSVKIWKVNPPGLVTSLLKPSREFVQDLDFSPDGKLLAIGLVGEVQLWDTQEWVQIFNFNKPSFIYSLSFSPDGEFLALGGWLEVQIRNTHNIDRKTKSSVSEANIVHSISGYNKRYWALAFSPDGELLAAGSTVWEMKSLKPVHTFENFVGTLAFSPDGRYFACGSGAPTLELWDVSTWEKISAPKVEVGMGVYSLTFSPDSKLLAVGFGFGDLGESVVKIFKVPGMSELKTLRGHQGSVNSVAFSPDGKFLASGGDNRVKIWDTRTYNLKYELRAHQGAIMSVAFSPDGKLLSSASKDGTVRLWDMKTGELMKTLEKGLTWVMCLSFSPNGRFLASGSIRIRPRRLVEKTVQIWDVTDGKLVAELKNLKGDIRAISFSPDGKLLALGSNTGVLSLWEMPPSVWTPEGLEPEGKEMASWGKIKRNALYQNYPNPFNSETWIPFAIADGSYVLIEIYDVAGKLIRRLDLGYKRGDDYSDKLKSAYWNGGDDTGEDVSSGLYFYTIKAGNFTATRKMVITK